MSQSHPPFSSFWFVYGRAWEWVQSYSHPVDTQLTLIASTSSYLQLASFPGCLSLMCVCDRAGTIFRYIDILRYSLSQYGIDTVHSVISMHAKVKVHFILHFLLFPQQEVALLAWRMEECTTVGLVLYPVEGLKDKVWGDTHVPLDVWSNISVTCLPHHARMVLGQLDWKDYSVATLLQARAVFVTYCSHPVW